MLKQKISALLTAVAITAVSLMPCTVSAEENSSMRDISTMQAVQEMGIGINLGNTFESCGDWIKQWGDGTPNAYETAWGSPTVTQSMIQGYADEGFGVLRVPVAWSNMMEEDGNYQINPEYLARVQQVIDWALEADLYVIMNLHWDSGWLENLPTDHDNCMRKYSVIWTQLCDAFGDYGDKLVFESQNEELGWQSVWNQWGGTEDQKKVSFAYCNEVNQKFVDIVRNSGKNNAQRHLLISGYNTSIDLTCDSLFKMPDDPSGKCAVSVHYYSPASFAILENDADWAKCTSTWGTDADFQELDRNMDLLKTTFVDKGIPVIIGEYGCPRKNKEEASVTKFLTSVCEASVKRGGICPVMWDITDLHYDRQTCKLKYPELKANFDAIREQYFPEQEKPTEPVTEPETVPAVPVTKGDVNFDGIINIYDFLLAKRNLMNHNYTPETDVNLDGVVSLTDIILLRKWLTGKISGFPVDNGIVLD